MSNSLEPRRWRRAPRSLWVVSRVFPPDEGGVQTYARSVARAYRDLGWDVRVFTKTSIGPRRVIEDGLRITDVGDGVKAAVYCRLFLALGWAALVGLMRGALPTAIHAATWRAALPVVLLGLGPLTITVHGREIGRPRGFGGWVMSRVVGAAVRVVAVSAWTQRHLLQRLPDLASRTVVAWNGLSDLALPSQDTRPIDPAGPLVLSVCRLVPRKNIRAAVAAAARCLQRGLVFRYWIAGRGPELDLIRAEVEALGLADRIRLLGYVSDDELAELHAQAEVFLHPQIELEDGAEMEGFGITIADAMARGSSCIVGEQGGPAELVSQRVTGHVVDGRSIDAIEAALAEVLDDPELRRRLGAAAREWTQEHLSWSRHAQLAVGAPV